MTINDLALFRVGHQLASEMLRTGLIQTVLGTLVATVFALRAVGHVNQAVLLWPVSAVGLALALPSWHLGLKRRIHLLLAAAGGFFIAAPIIGMPFWIALLIGTLTCVDIVVSASILSPWVKSFDDLRHQSNIVRFLAATIVGPIVTGVAGAYPISSFLKQPWSQTAQTNGLAVSLGLAVVTPLVLFVQDQKARSLSRLVPNAKRTAVSAVAFVIVCSFVFYQNTSPFLFLIFPPMIFLLLTTGLDGAIFASIAVTAIGWTGTMHGHGPILLMRGTALDHLKILQIFSWVCVAAVLPIGALLDERKQAEIEIVDALNGKSRLAQELESSHHLFLSFAEHSPNVTFIKDAESRYVYYNQRFAELFGIDNTEWLGKADHDLFPSSFAETFRANDLLVMNTGQVLEVIEKLKDPEGTLRSFKSVKFAYKDAHGKSMLAGVAVDISAEVRHAEEMASVNRKLELLATTDALTGLPNRRSFEERAEVEFAVARRKERPLSIAVLDIDNFKRRNDSFGHAAGDEALRVLGTVLSSCGRTGDLMARLGGEEFGMLLPDTEGEGAMELTKRLQTLLRRAEHGPLPLTISVGVATLDQATGNWQRLLAKADDAMYEAKKTGKDKCVHHRDLLANLLEAAVNQKSA